MRKSKKPPKKLQKKRHRRYRKRPRLLLNRHRQKRIQRAPTFLTVY